MNTSLRFLLAAGVSLGSLDFIAQSALAVPLSGVDSTLTSTADEVQPVANTRRICGPHTCHRVRECRHFEWGPCYGWWSPERWDPYAWYPDGIYHNRYYY